MTGKKLALRHRNALLDRLLEQPDLVERVQQLPPESLARAIRHIGIEDAGALLSMATAEQLARVFDEELWVSERPGEDETFDAPRFALWLNVLLEGGAAFAAQKLLELDTDFVAMAFSSLVLVIDIEALAVRMSNADRSGADDLLDKQLESGLYQELEEYRVIAKDPSGFEAVVAIMLEWNEQRFDFLQRVLERCAELSDEYIDEHGGLLPALSAAEALAEAVAGERADRREQLGYVAPSDARAFLKLCTQRDEREILEATELDPLTRAHFRALANAPRSSVAPSPARGGGHDALAELVLASAREEQAPLDRRLSAGDDTSAAWLRYALMDLREADAALYDRRALELAYLANVLLAGQAHEGRRLRPVEAFELAVSLCELGGTRLLALLKKRSLQPDASLLGDHDLIKLFQLGYGIWQRDPRRGSSAPPRQ